MSGDPLAFLASRVLEGLGYRLVRVRISERTALLRRRRFSFCRLRLIWLLMFATGRPGSSGTGPDFGEAWKG